VMTMEDRSTSPPRMEIAAGVNDTGAGLRQVLPNASAPKSRMWTHKSGSVRGTVRENGPYSTPRREPWVNRGRQPQPA